MKIKDIMENIVLYTAFLINNLVPKKKNKIIFYSMPDYTDNARAIYEQLRIIDKNNFYDVTWVVSNVKKNKMLHPDINFVKHRSVKSLFAMYRSKYIIRTHSFWGNKYVKNRQIMCVAWHGMLIKGYTEEDTHTPPNSFDHFCVTSPLFADMYAKLMNCDLDRMIVTGYPRNDNLFNKSPTLLTELSLDEYKKIIIWMPTFRTRCYSSEIEGKESCFGLPTINNDDELVILNDLLKQKNYCLIIKLHPWALKGMEKFSFSNIRQLKDEDIPDKYSLYSFIGKADALISDYSSVWGDYLLVDKPIGFAFDDLEEYKKTRTMTLDPIEDYMPGMRIRNISELLQFINSLDEQDDYKEARQKIRNLFLTNCDNKSSLRFLEAVGIIDELKKN